MNRMTNRQPTTPGSEYRVYVLNGAFFSGNNASLTRFTFSDSAVANDMFLQQNGRGLGDTTAIWLFTVSCMQWSMSVRFQPKPVMDARTCMGLKQIPLFDGTTARQPRKIAFYAATHLSAFDELLRSSIPFTDCYEVYSGRPQSRWHHRCRW
ncbi:MAG: hypothetical protein IPH20_21320 [Bacteroidales bacterium]|nr:hypothetical protein [Bacteroidales bacterium]